MNIVYFVLIVTVAAFCGGLAGSLITCAARKNKQKKSRAEILARVQQNKEVRHGTKRA